MTEQGLGILDPGVPATATLLLARLTGLVLIAPVLSARVLPVPVKAAMSLVLVALLLPVALNTAPDMQAVEVTPLTVASEMVIGFVIGLGAAVLVGAAETAGDYMAMQMGLSGASTLDPTTHANIPVMGQFMQVMAVALLLALDGHVMMIGALVTSLEASPVGSEPALADGLAAAVGLGTIMFRQGLLFAAPIMAAALVGNVAIGILARTVPQLNILMVAFPLQIGVGLVMLGGAIPLMGAVIGNWPGAYEGIFLHLMGAMGGR